MRDAITQGDQLLQQGVFTEGGKLSVQFLEQELALSKKGPNVLQDKGTSLDEGNVRGS